MRDCVIPIGSASYRLPSPASSPQGGLSTGSSRGPPGRSLQYLIQVEIDDSPPTMDSHVPSEKARERGEGGEGGQRKQGTHAGKRSVLEVEISDQKAVEARKLPRRDVGSAFLRSADSCRDTQGGVPDSSPAAALCCQLWEKDGGSFGCNLPAGHEGEHNWLSMSSKVPLMRSPQPFPQAKSKSKSKAKSKRRAAAKGMLPVQEEESGGASAPGSEFEPPLGVKTMAGARSRVRQGSAFLCGGCLKSKDFLFCSTELAETVGRRAGGRFSLTSNDLCCSDCRCELVSRLSGADAPFDSSCPACRLPRSTAPLA